jgi:hypothetical protein
MRHAMLIFGSLVSPNGSKVVAAAVVQSPARTCIQNFSRYFLRTTLRFTSSDRGQGQHPGIAPRPRKKKEKKRKESQCRQNGTAAHAALLSGSDAADPAVTGRRRRDLCCSLCTCRPGTSRLRPAGLGTDVAAVASGHAAAVTPGQRHRRPAGRRTHVCLCGWSGALAVPVPRATVPGSGFLMCCLGQSVACCRGAVAFAHLSFG